MSSGLVPVHLGWINSIRRAGFLENAALFIIFKSELTPRCLNCKKTYNIQLGVTVLLFFAGRVAGTTLGTLLTIIIVHGRVLMAS